MGTCEHGCHLGRVRGHNNLQLTLTHSLSTAAAAAAEFAADTLLLLIALLEIVLLLLPDNTPGLSFKQREAWSGWLTDCDSQLLSLPGCCPQLARRRLLDLLPHQPIVGEGASLARRGSKM